MLKHITFLAILSFSLFACTHKEYPLGSEKNPVKFYFVPSTDTSVLNNGAKLIKDFLETKTGYKFETAIPASYIAVVEAFGSNRADVAILNTYGYILAHDKYGAEAGVRFVRFGEVTYKAQIITKQDSKIKTLSDLAGKKFAYVDPASLSGYLLPAQLFKDNNIKPAETVFANKHDNVVTMVYQGQVDAGATFYSPPHEGKIMDARKLVQTQFPDVEKKIKIIGFSKDVPNDPVLFRKGLPEEMKNKISQALSEFLATPEGKDVLFKMYSITGFVPAKDSDYDVVREMLKTVGKTASDMLNK